MLIDLPYPALSLLIASVQAGIAGYAFITFEMLYDYFRVQVRSSTAAPVQLNGGSIGMIKCTREVLLGVSFFLSEMVYADVTYQAFESLVAHRIFMPVAAPTANIGKEFVRYRSVLNFNEVKQAIEKTGIISLTRWLNKAE